MGESARALWNLPPLWTIWGFEPSVIAGCVAAAVLYPIGLRWLNQHGREPGRFGPGNPIWFYVGLVLWYISLESFVDIFGEEYLFAIHMVQHLLIVFVDAPLLLVGMRGNVPELAFITPAFRFLSRPVVATVAFLGDLYLWHIPWMYDWTLRNDAVHALEHLTFLITGVLIWQWIFGYVWPSCSDLMPRGQMRWIYSIIVIALMGVLGIIIITPWVKYSYYWNLPVRLWGITPVEDQMFSGLIMMLGGGLALMVMLFALDMQQGQGGRSSKTTSAGAVRRQVQAQAETREG